MRLLLLAQLLARLTAAQSKLRIHARNGRLGSSFLPAILTISQHMDGPDLLLQCCLLLLDVPLQVRCHCSLDFLKPRLGRQQPEAQSVLRMAPRGPSVPRTFDASLTEGRHLTQLDTST